MTCQRSWTPARWNCTLTWSRAQGKWRRTGELEEFVAPVLPWLLPKDEQQQAQFSILFGATYGPSKHKIIWRLLPFCLVARLNQRRTAKGILGNVVLTYLNSFHVSYQVKEESRTQGKFDMNYVKFIWFRMLYEVTGLEEYCTIPLPLQDIATK